MKGPTQPPKTEGAPRGSPLVSDSITSAAEKIAALPAWLQHEIVTQVPVGGRNNHCIKIAPALMREGMTPDETLAVLVNLYPGAKTGEIEGVVTRAEVYAQTEREQDPEFQANAARRAELREAAQAAMPRIVAEYQMPEVDSPCPDWELEHQRRAFLVRMFDPEDIVWIGEPTHSGPRFKHHFKRARAWLDRRRGSIPGEFITHSTFKPGSVHRDYASIEKRRYLVLESDILPPDELAAVARYLRDHHCLIMRAIVTTGGKRHAPAAGLHFWFQYPGDSVIEDWAAVLQGYGADVATLRGPQPVRLPGCIRRDTGLKQKLWWLA